LNVNQNLKKALQFLLFLSIGVAILLWFYNAQNDAYQAQLRLENKPALPLWAKLWADFQTVKPGWVLLTLACFTFSNYSRAVRWNMLIRPLGYEPKVWNAFFAVNISYFTNLWMSRAGEVVRASSLARVEGISISRVMGTIIVDRLLDVLSLALVMGLAFWLQYDIIWGYLDQHIGSGDGKFRLLKHPIFLSILGLGFVCLGLLWFNRKRLLEMPIIKKIWGVAERFFEGLRTIGSVENKGLFLFHSINIWVMFYLMTYVCFFAFEPTAHLTPLAALTVFVFGSFGIVIPSPGGMGTYHVLATAALVIYGVKQDDAFSFANIMFFAVQIFYNIVSGFISIFLIRYMNKNKTLSSDFTTLKDSDVDTAFDEK
jgi:glycosyltransferase 2 family protein